MKIDFKNKDILSLEEYAKLKNVSLKTVYNWINVGMIKPIKIGKTKFIINDNKK
jgi:predicted site-specific integrase-resolvase